MIRVLELPGLKMDGAAVACILHQLNGGNHFGECS